MDDRPIVPIDRRSADQEQKARVQQRLTTIEAEIQNLTGAIATGAPAGPLTEAIRARDAERQRLQAELAALDVVPTLTRRDREELRGELVDLMAEWRAVLLGHTAATRQAVRKLLADKVRFIPEERECVAGWRLEAEGTVRPPISGHFSELGDVVQKVARPAGLDPATSWFAVVAEPSTPSITGPHGVSWARSLRCSPNAPTRTA